MSLENYCEGRRIDSTPSEEGLFSIGMLARQYSARVVLAAFVLRE